MISGEANTCNRHFRRNEMPNKTDLCISLKLLLDIAVLTVMQKLLIYFKLNCSLLENFCITFLSTKALDKFDIEDNMFC